ncbi:MAG: cbb3-type cytochrome c oxidase subunit I [Thermincola sp.]|jgi:nitric oxide reductase subunit B|nr:cbb3-type cytochrome c oxidase subunit I [Thermincola sp.]MDT3701860.1 cbb3-type cytochrome c oxidase subunit I [Thermincola sp.]
MESSISGRLKWFFIICLFGAMAVALIGGIATFDEAPPYPAKVVSEKGDLIFDKDDILLGQASYQEYGLMDLGSVWGHGTYRGPDFSAEALHNIGLSMREFYAKKNFNSDYEKLGTAEKSAVDGLMLADIKTNRYDAASETLTLTEAQIYALEEVRKYYDELFDKGDPQKVIYAGTVKIAEKRQALADFFYWTAWCAGTNRPGSELTYTNNWPPDAMVGNTPAEQAVTWTVASVLAFIGLLGLIAFVFHRYGFAGSERHDLEMSTQLAEAPISPSQIKVAKYFLVVVALFLLQTLAGGFMAHSTVNPETFYGMDSVKEIIPYNWAKTWHLQLAVFWIATAWVGSAIYFAPIIGGKEPKLQGLLVDLLFVAVIIVAVGSLIGEVVGLKGGLGGSAWFWLGHQGWEYLELGRLWQILLLVGLILWLIIVARAVKKHLTAGADKWDLPNFYVYSAIGIVGFWCFGMFYDPKTNLTIADFWRWWTVHTWVEGMFEFFAAAAMAFVAVRTGMATKKAALRAGYLTASLALATGIIGVGHHYYYFGMPTFWMALGGVLSAMEPVPILLLLGEAWQRSNTLRKAGPDFPYRWPLKFFIAAGIWNFVGAGIMGFAITTPIVNYYEHSTYLTVSHGHTAFFGTYGMLAIGLLLFAYRGIVQKKAWDAKANLLKVSFWGLNIGLATMFVLTLLPVGFWQLQASFTKGLWYARSPEFYSNPMVQAVGEFRILPDSIIIVLGAIPLVLFMVTTITKLKPVTVKENQEITFTEGKNIKG